MWNKFYLRRKNLKTKWNVCVLYFVRDSSKFELVDSSGLGHTIKTEREVRKNKCWHVGSTSPFMLDLEGPVMIIIGLTLRLIKRIICNLKLFQSKDNKDSDHDWTLVTRSNIKQPEIYIIFLFVFRVLGPYASRHRPKMLQALISPTFKLVNITRFYSLKIK